LQYNAHTKHLRIQTYIAGITLDIILIPLITYKTVQTSNGRWHDGRRNALTGNDPEKVSNMQKTNPKSYKREGRAEKLCWHDNLWYGPC